MLQHDHDPIVFSLSKKPMRQHASFPGLPKAMRNWNGQNYWIMIVLEHYSFASLIINSLISRASKLAYSRQ